MVVEHNPRSTLAGRLTELRDAPLGLHSIETMELDWWEPTMDTPHHLSRHPYRIHDNEWFSFVHGTNRVRWYDTTWHWWSGQLRRSTTSWTERVKPMLAKVKCELSLHDTVRWKWDHVHLLPVTLSSSVIPEFQLTHCGSVKMHLEAMIEQDWKCTWKTWSSEFGDALGGNDRVNVKAIIETIWRYTLRL